MTVPITIPASMAAPGVLVWVTVPVEVATSGRIIFIDSTSTYGRPSATCPPDGTRYRTIFPDDGARSTVGSKSSGKVHGQPSTWHFMPDLAGSLCTMCERAPRRTFRAPSGSISTCGERRRGVRRKEASAGGIV